MQNTTACIHFWVWTRSFCRAGEGHLPSPRTLSWLDVNMGSKHEGFSLCVPVFQEAMSFGLWSLTFSDLVNNTLSPLFFLILWQFHTCIHWVSYWPVFTHTGIITANPSPQRRWELPSAGYWCKYQKVVGGKDQLPVVLSCFRSCSRPQSRDFH